jgi:hypothetical protein
MSGAPARLPSQGVRGAQGSGQALRAPTIRGGAGRGYGARSCVACRRAPPSARSNINPTPPPGGKAAPCCRACVRMPDLTLAPLPRRQKMLCAGGWGGSIERRTGQLLAPFKLFKIFLEDSFPYQNEKCTRIWKRKKRHFNTIQHTIKIIPAKRKRTT